MGKNLYCEVPISFTDAALGGELEVPTLDGRGKAENSGRNPDAANCSGVRGKGVAPVRGGGTGDLLCRVVVETPVNLSVEQKELMKQLHVSCEGGKNSPRKTSWFDGVKSFFDNF